MSRRFTAHRPAPAKGAADRSAGAAEPAGEGPVSPEKAAARPRSDQETLPKEFGGPEGPEPTRYGDWERKGICVDF